MLAPHDSEILKRFERRDTPAEVTGVYLPNSLFIATPDAVDAVNKARKRCVEVLEQGARVATAAAAGTAATTAGIPSGKGKFPSPATTARHFGVEWFLHNAVRNIQVQALRGRVKRERFKHKTITG